MNAEYLLVLVGRTFTREVELDAESTLVRIGTTARCDVRFRKDQFYVPFELELTKRDDDGWDLTCSDEVYLADGGVQRRNVVALEHADVYTVKYAQRDATLFSLRFGINFDHACGAYDRWVSLRDVSTLSIGSMPSCALELESPFTNGDLLVLSRDGGALVLTERVSRYGVLLDGVRINGQTELKDRSFFSVAGFHFYVSHECLYFSSEDAIRVHGVNCHDVRAKAPYAAYPKFNRNTRVKTVPCDEPIPILDPPSKPEKPRGNIVLRLLPAVGMLAVVVLVRGTLMSSSNSAFIIISACSICVGILASVLSIISDKRTYKKELEERDTMYRSYIDEKRATVEGAREEERKTLLALYPSVEQQLERVEDFSGDLFDRRAQDADFLQVRVGLGSRRSLRQLDYKVRESFDDDELAVLPEQLQSEYRDVRDAPIVLGLDADAAVGIVGPFGKTMAVMKRMAVDVCTRQHDADVRLMFVVEPEHEDCVRWVRMLPHVRNDGLHMRNIVCDEESKNILFEQLFKVLTARAASKEPVREPHIVVFFIDEYGFKNHPLCKFADSASELGATFVFLERAKELLPQGCNHIIELSGDGDAGTLVDVEDARSAAAFTYTPVQDVALERMATTLAPMYCDEVSLEGSLTKSITMFDMLGIIAADDLDLEARWAASAVHKSMAAPIGVSKTRTVMLDLHDKAHGPHGLVAGTTGSGKSEALQTYVLSMATLYSPYEVGFVIIDFKGGGMVNQFRDLPHLVGAITNIDGREINRSLKSIKAELQKRQRCFADAGVNHISAYIKLYKAGKVEVPLPHLIIIVDEFAELKAEQPEFMKELISASRIGRSLGVHLILATQKPAGQVSEQIWSNSRFKLCLKVASAQDSNEVIKSPLAAEIKEAGRGYLQVGNNEIFELFQSAYSGAPEHVDEDTTREFTLYDVTTSGKRVPVFERKREKRVASSVTQLEAIVGHVADYCAHAGIVRLPSICLPPLTELVPCPEHALMGEHGMALGIYDDPSSQYQGEACFDIEGSNTFIVGSAQSGKTNLLQVIIRSIASVCTPAQATFYILDFASMALKNFEGLAHVGGVVIPSEEERVRNLFRLLDEELAVRRKKLLDAGVSSYSSYVELGNTDLPHIYVVLDNFAVFKELYADRYEGDLLSLCRDGLAYGINVIVANGATSGFGYKYLSNFSTHIALQCNDTGEYSTMFGRCRMEPKAVPGRALMSTDKTIYEFQSYLAFAGEREVERVQAMRAFVEAVNANCAGMHAKRIPCVPDDLSLAYIHENYRIEQAHELAFALDYGTVAPVRLPLGRQFSLAIVGKEAPARERVLRVLLADVEDGIFERPVELSIVDGMERSLCAWADRPYTVAYHTDATQLSLVLEDTAARLQERYERVMEDGMEALADEPYLLVVVNSQDAIAHVSESKELVALYGDISKKYSALRVLFVFSCVPDASVSFSAPALLKAIKDERRAFITSPLDEHKVYDIGAALVRAFRGRLEDGQAFYLSGSDIAKVRLAQHFGE